MSDAFDSTSITEESVEAYFRQLVHLHSNVLPNVSDPVDRLLTILTFNTNFTLGRHRHSDKVLGNIEYVQGPSNTIQRDSYFNYVLFEMMKNDDIFKLLGITLHDALHMGYHKFKLIVDRISEYQEKKKAIVSEKEDELLKLQQNIQQEINSQNEEVRTTRW